MFVDSRNNAILQMAYVILLKPKFSLIDDDELLMPYKGPMKYNSLMLGHP